MKILKVEKDKAQVELTERDLKYIISLLELFKASYQQYFENHSKSSYILNRILNSFYKTLEEVLCMKIEVTGRISPLLNAFKYNGNWYPNYFSMIVSKANDGNLTEKDKKQFERLIKRSNVGTVIKLKSK